jgi:hypothetical protein
VQEIADWLDKFGLGQYAQRFAEKDISFFILPDLTDQDLEKIGVASLGHRRRIENRRYGRAYVRDGGFGTFCLSQDGQALQDVPLPSTAETARNA